MAPRSPHPLVHLEQDVLPKRPDGPKGLIAFKSQQNNLRQEWSEMLLCVYRLVVRMAAFQAVDMGSNPVKRMKGRRPDYESPSW